MIRKSTWIVLVIFILAVGGAYLWQRAQTQKAAQVTPTAAAAPAYLFDIQGQISRVRIERADGRTLEIKLDDQGKWRISLPTGLQADSDAAGSALAQVAVIPVVAALETPPAPAAMALDQPASRLLVTNAEGRTWSADIGALTPTSSGYYASSGGKVYIVSKYALDPILGLVDTPPVLQSTPTPDESQPAPAATETPSAP